MSVPARIDHVHIRWANLHDHIVEHANIDSASMNFYSQDDTQSSELVLLLNKFDGAVLFCLYSILVYIQSHSYFAAWRRLLLKDKIFSHTAYNYLFAKYFLKHFRIITLSMPAESHSIAHEKSADT